MYHVLAQYVINGTVASSNINSLSLKLHVLSTEYSSEDCTEEPEDGTPAEGLNTPHRDISRPIAVRLTNKVLYRKCV